MEYNKRVFSKINDHKVLHKVKKQWVVMSMAMLALLGGGAVAHKVSAHADVTNQNNTALKTRLNSSLQQTNKSTQVHYSQNQLVNNDNQKSTNDGRQTTNAISQQANTLHNRIIQNADFNRNNNDNGDNNKQFKPQQNNQIHINPRNAQTASAQGTQNDLGGRITKSTNDLKTVNAPQAPVDAKNYKKINNKPLNKIRYHIYQPYDVGSVVNSGHWGTANWNLENNGHLIIYASRNSDAISNNSGNGITAENTGIPFNAVSNISFGNEVKAPVNCGNLFAHLPSNVTSVNVDNLDTSASTGMANMFSSDSNLQKLQLDELNTSAADNMSDMFANDPQLSNIVGLDNFDTTSVNNMNKMFLNDSALHSLDLSEFNTGTVSSMNNMFSGTDIQSLKLGGGTVFNTSIGLTGKSRYWQNANVPLDTNYDDPNFSVVDLENHQVHPGTWNQFQGQYGKWGSADWLLDNNNNLWVANGTLAPDTEDPADTMNYIPQRYLNNILTLTFYNVVAPAQSENLLGTGDSSNRPGGTSPSNPYGEIWPQLRFMDITNLDSSHVQNAYTMFDGNIRMINIKGLRTFHISSDNDAWLFANSPSLTSLDLSTIGTIQSSAFVDDGTYSGYDDNDLAAVRFGPRTKLSTACGLPDSNDWVNAKGQSVQLVDGDTHDSDPNASDTEVYYNTANCVQATINYYFGSQQVGQQSGWVPKFLNTEDMSFPNGYTLNPFGRQNYTISEHQTLNVPVVRTGLWNTATWDLDPQGNLYIHDGILSSDNGNNGGVADDTSIGPSNVKTVKFNQHVNAPSNANNLFSHLPNVTNFDASNLNTINTNSMQSMFADNPKLNNLNVNGFNTNGVSNMSHMFESDGVINLDLSSFNTYRVNNMSYMFYKLPRLKNLNISHFDTSAVNIMDNMFTGSLTNKNDEVEKIIIGNNTKIYNVNRAGDPNLSSNWENAVTGSYVNLDDNQNPVAGIYYNTDRVARITVDYKFMNHVVGTQIAWLSKHLDTRSNEMRVPDGYVIDPSVPKYYNLTNNKTFIVKVDKALNINCYYGSRPVGSGLAYFSHYGDYPINNTNCADIPRGYSIDPRSNEVISINLDGSTNNDVQVDRAGQWNTANWYLTPDGDQLNDQNGKPLPKGNLYITNGSINGNDNNNAISDNAGMTPSDMSDVYNISGSNVSVSNDANHLLSGLKNLTDIESMSNWDVRNITSLKNAFQNDSSLSNWSSIKNNWQFNTQPNTYKMFQSDNKIGDVSPSTYQHSELDNRWMFKLPLKLSYNVPITIKFVNSNGSVQKTASDQPYIKVPNIKLDTYDGFDTGFTTPTESDYTLVNTNNFKAKLHLNDPKWIWDTNAFSAYPEAENANYTSGDNWDSTKNRPMLVFKAGDANNINLNYINQSGRPIDYSPSINKAQYGISDSPYNHIINDTINGKGRRGDHLNVLNPKRETPYFFNGYPTPDPKDYTVNSSQINSDYVFNNHQQNVTVPLIGKSTANQSDENNVVKVNIYTGNSHGSDFQSDGHPKYTTTVHLKGQIGSFIDFGPSNLLNQTDSDGSKNPLYYGNLRDSNGSGIDLAHYVADPPHADNSDQQYYLHGNGNQTATLYHTKGMTPTTSAENPSPATVNFYYDASPSYSSDVRPITVKYIDQHKNPIDTDVINPTASDFGQQINVINSDSKLNAANGKSAQGMNVPNGYHLVDHPDVNYRITNHAQEVNLHVQGNQQQINSGATGDALPIHIVANVYQSDGTTPDTKTQDTVSDGQGHSKSFTRYVSDVVYPKLDGNVGNSRVISATSYQPQINDQQQMVESTGTNKYTVHFKQPQKNQSDISVDGVTNPNSKGITFNYTIVDKPQAQQRNYIHYISYSDVDNRGDITTQPNHQGFPTQVSDASSDNSKSFSDKYYRENVPTGYQFYKVYSANGNTNDNQINKGLTQFGNGQGGPGEEYIEVIPNASPITFHYINQNGSDVKDVQVSGNGSDKNAASGESDYTSNFGTKITSNQINQSGQSDDKLGAPQGYQYNALTDSQGKGTTIGETQPVFSRDPQDVYIPVTGKTYNKINVQLQQDFFGVNNNKFAKSDTYTINNAQVGRNYTIYGVDLSTPSAADSGYTLNQSDHPFKVTVHINPDNSYSFLDQSNNPDGRAETSSDQGSVGSIISVNNISDIKNNNKIQFDPNTGNPTATKPPKASFWYHITNNVSKPLTLIYINQAGQQVGCADKMQGTVGSDINVTDPSQGGERIPSDYQLDGGSTANKKITKIINGQSSIVPDYNSDVTGTNQDTKYQFTSEPQTIYLHVTGEQHSPRITVYTVAKNSDGTTTFSHKPGVVKGSDGSLVGVNPDDYNPDPSKYSIDYSKDSTQFVRIGQNQGKQIVVTPNRLIFYYVNTTTDGAPITLRYINHKTGQEVGYTKVINGNLSDKVDVASSDPVKGELAGEDVPAGYQIDTNPKDLPQSNLQNEDDLKDGKSKQPIYQFSKSPQMLNIPVNGDSDTLTYHIHVFKESSDGTIQGPTSDVALHIHGNVGDTIHISPYGFKLNKGSDIKSMSDKSVSDDKVHDTGISSYGVPTGGGGYHATNTDLDKDIQINANGQLSPDSNTNYFYRQNYEAQKVGTVRIHYITGTINNNTTFDNTGAPTDDASQVDMVSDKGTVGNDYTNAGTFDLSPYRDDIPEELSVNYESADNAMNKDGTQIKDDQKDNQWQYSESNNGFTNGVRDIYIQVTKRGTNNTSNGPIIIGSDGNMLNQ